MVDTICENIINNFVILQKINTWVGEAAISQ